MIHTPSTKTFGKKLKTQLIANYETACEITGCYSCNEEKAKEKRWQEQKQRELEEKREKAKKEEEKAQKQWREYFGMSKSQAEESNKEKSKKIQEEYNKLMKKRGQMVDGTNGMI